MTGGRTKYRLAWAAVVAAGLIVIFAGLGAAPFFDRDEGEYATVAKSMIERSDWVIPHVNDRPYYEKPPLYFWLTAASFQVFGFNETAGRLPSALAGMALALLVGWFGTRRTGARFGLLGASFVLTSFLTVLLSRVALMDVLLTLWTTAALFSFYEGYVSPPGDDRPWFLAAWAAVALGFLTKGPVGAVIPLVAAFVLILFNRDFIATIRRARVPAGLIVFLAVAGPWYTLAFIREGKNFWQGFFISQNVGRFTDVVLGHGAPLWFYIPVLAVLVWPWFFFAVPALWRGVAGNPRANRDVSPDAALDFFLSVWFMTSFLVFSAAATKQPNYVLPSVPPLLLLAARWWDARLSGEPDGRRGLRILAGLTAFTGAALGLFFLLAAHLLPRFHNRALSAVNPDSFEYAFPAAPPDLGPATAVVGALILLAVGAYLYFTKTGRRKSTLAALAVGALVFILGVSHVTAPAMLGYLQAPARDLAEHTAATMGPRDRLASYGLYKPTLWFYTGRHIDRVRVHETAKLESLLNEDRRILFLSRLSLVEKLEAYDRFRRIDTSGGYVLGDNRGDGR